MTIHGEREWSEAVAPLFRPLLPPWIALAQMAPALADPAALHAQEREQIARAVDKRRREYAAGRILARRLLRSSAMAVDAPLLNDAQRVPQWPSGVLGSITHCHDLCVVAVAPQARLDGLGIDIELAEPLPEGVAGQVVLPGERERIAQLPAELREHGERLVFSAKEAAYKALYPRTRRFLDFPELQVLLDADGGFEVSPMHADCGFSGRFSGRYRVHGGHLATAVALLPGTLHFAPMRAPA